MKFKPVQWVHIAKSTVDEETGEPAKFTLRKLRTSVVLPILRDNPHIPQVLLSEEEKAEMQRRVEAMTPTEKQKRYEEFEKTAERLVCASCVEPKFTLGSGADGVSVFDVASIEDDDLFEMMDDILTNSGYAGSAKANKKERDKDNEEADALSRFPDGVEEGRGGGGAVGEAGAVPEAPK